MNLWKESYWLGGVCSLLMAAGGCANDQSCRGGSCGAPSHSSSTYASPAYPSSDAFGPAYGTPVGSDTRAPAYSEPSYQGSGTR